MTNGYWIIERSSCEECQGGGVIQNPLGQLQAWLVGQTWTDHVNLEIEEEDNE